MRYNIPVSPASLPAIKRLGLRAISCIGLINLDASPASQQVLQSVAHYLGPHLQSLCLGGGSPTEASFVALILGCPALRILDLSGCNSLFTSGTLLAQPETAQSVRKALSGLRELHLAGLRDLADPSFNQLSSCAPSLERLSLAYCHLTFEPGLARGSAGSQDYPPSKLSFSNLLRFVRERASRLRALDLGGTGLQAEALKALGQVAGLQLQELSLHSCRDLSTEAVATLCRQQPGLTSLDLSGCSELTDGALLAVGRGLRHLQRLCLGKLQRLTDAGCTALGGLQHLRSLDMAGCCLVSGRELAQALGPVHGVPRPLASLMLAYCSSLKVSPLFLSFTLGAGSGRDHRLAVSHETWAHSLEGQKPQQLLPAPLLRLLGVQGEGHSAQYSTCQVPTGCCRLGEGHRWGGRGAGREWGEEGTQSEPQEAVGAARSFHGIGQLLNQSSGLPLCAAVLTLSVQTGHSQAEASLSAFISSLPLFPLAS